MRSKIFVGISVAVLCTLFSGCQKKIARVNPPAPTPVATAKAASPQETARATAPVAPHEAANTPDEATKQRIQDLLDRIQDVYFDYNKHNLRPDGEAALESDAKTLTQILKQYPNYKLTIEGYCDERGSEEYNLALGDQRAKQAEDVLVTLGLPANQLRIVSYGKEHPVCREHSEACWQKNRRAHITQDQQSS